MTATATATTRLFGVRLELIGLRRAGDGAAENTLPGSAGRAKIGGAASAERPGAMDAVAPDGGEPAMHEKLGRLFLACLALAVAADAVLADDMAGEITGSAVRLRAGPGTVHAVLAQLDKGDLVVIEGREGRWVKVRVPGGFPCYVHADLVKRRGGGDAVVGADRVLLRATPGKELLALETVLAEGERVVVLGEEGEWLKILPPERAHLFVFEELVAELGPSSEYRAALARAAEVRRAGLVGVTGAAPEKEDPEAKREARRKEVVRLGGLVLAGEGETEEVTNALRLIVLESDDDLTSGYAESLLVLMTLRSGAEQLRERVAAADRERDEVAEDLARQAAEAEVRYEAELEKARALRLLRERPYRGVGVVERRGAEIVLVEDGAVLLVMTSKLFKLADYVGRRVGVNGRMVLKDRTTGATHLLVEKLEILGAKPEGR